MSKTSIQLPGSLVSLSVFLVLGTAIEGLSSAGSPFAIRLKATKGTYAPDEPIVVTVSVENVSSDYEKINLTAEGELFRFEVTNEAGQALDSTVRRGGMHRVNLVRLPPRHGICWQVDLRKRYPSLKALGPGRYRAVARYVGIEGSSETVALGVLKPSALMVPTITGRQTGLNDLGLPSARPSDPQGQRMLMARTFLPGRPLDWEAIAHSVKRGEFTFLEWAEKVRGLAPLHGRELRNGDLAQDPAGLEVLVTGTVAAIWYHEFVSQWTGMSEEERGKKLQQLGGSNFKAYASAQLSRICRSVSWLVQRWPGISMASQATHILRELGTAQCAWRGMGLLPPPLHSIGDWTIALDKADGPTGAGMVTYPILAASGLGYRFGVDESVKCHEPYPRIHPKVRWRESTEIKGIDLSTEDRRVALLHTGLVMELPETEPRWMIARQAYPGIAVYVNMGVPSVGLRSEHWRNTPATFGKWLALGQRPSPWSSRRPQSIPGRAFRELEPWLVPAYTVDSEQHSFRVWVASGGASGQRIPTGWTVDIVLPRKGAEFALSYTYETWSPVLGFTWPWVH